MAKFRVVETNDNGKTDLKDPHIIHTLASINKVLRHRELTDEYLLLRKTGVLYDQADRAIVSVRCRLHRSLVELFCDYSFSNDFLYSNSGRALMDKYGCNPYRIVRAGRGRFERAMRRRAPRIQQRSLDRLWRDASNSARHQLTPEFTDLLEMATRQLWEEFLLHEERKTDFANRMISLLDRLRAKDPKIPEPTPGVISAKNLARLLAETGPLDDFTSWRMLLAQIVLPLVRKKSLYGEFYHGKRVTMPGQKAMTVVMRLFLRKLHGWYRAGEAVNEERHFTCSASYTAKQAA